MIELHQYLDLTLKDAETQWREMLARTEKKRQDDFTPVETLLSFGLGQLGTISAAGNVNIRESDPNAQKVAVLGKRNTKSIAAKLGNLDGWREHSAKHERALWNALTSDKDLWIHLYGTVVVAARQVGIGPDRLPDFLGVESRALEAVLDANQISDSELRESIDEEVRGSKLAHPDWDLAETERSMIGSARIGQQQFARRVLENCGFGCVFCGLQFRSNELPSSRMLVASHIKAWRVSDNEERLDFKNGLAACPTHDAAFDAFLLTVSFDMKVVLSPALAQAVDQDAVVSRNFGPTGVFRNVQLPAEAIQPGRGYLDWHHAMALQKG